MLFPGSFSKWWVGNIEVDVCHVSASTDLDRKQWNWVNIKEPEQTAGPSLWFQLPVARGTKYNLAGNSFHPAVIPAMLGSPATMQRWLSGQDASLCALVAPSEVEACYQSLLAVTQKAARNTHVTCVLVPSPYGSHSFADELLKSLQCFHPQPNLCRAAYSRPEGKHIHLLLPLLHRESQRPRLSRMQLLLQPTWPMFGQPCNFLPVLVR